MMESYDAQKTARVWERVRGGEDPSVLADLVGQEWLDAAIYMALSRMIPGRDGQLLRQLARQEQDHAACLRGIYTLQTGSRPTIRTPVVPRENGEQLLRRAYGSHMHRLARYESRKGDPEYGQIFARLAEQERAQCQQILALIGRLKK